MIIVELYVCYFRGTTDYDDLWGFIEKYQSFHKKKAGKYIFFKLSY